MKVFDNDKTFQLHDRKPKVLAAIVDEYLRTGEPVGSRAVVSLLDMNVSSATIRNDMAALEKLGLIEQPHTSAGRIPSYLGYRYYIEHLMDPKPLSQKEKKLIDSLLADKQCSTNMMVENAADALAALTGCAALTSVEAPEFSVISKVQVLPAGYHLYALLIITSGGEIKNKICRLEFDLSDEMLEFFENFINDNLHGINAKNLNPAYLQKLALALGSYTISLTPLLYALYELSGELVAKNVNLKGEANLLSFNDVDAAEIVKFLSAKNNLTSLLDGAFSGVNVVFGREDENFAISNGSMIVSQYSIGADKGGYLGLVGPIRLDYAKLIPYVEYFSEKITGLLTEISGDNKDKKENKNGG